jgi:hypothetical protein
MRTGTGQVNELILQGGIRHARISCPENLIPAPGQYLTASHGSDAVLPVSVFYTDSAPEGSAVAPWRHFIAAPIPDSWAPGMEIQIRGPFGRGFNLPTSARRVCFVAMDESFAGANGLILPALKQGAAVTCVTDTWFDNLPDVVEIQPLSSLGEIFTWADYVAFDVARERLPELNDKLRELNLIPYKGAAEVLVRAPMPCGGIADCGVCAVRTKHEWKMICRDGPVFKVGEV